MALARGDETALPCPWEVPWDIGAPLPHVISSGSRTFLIYLVREPDHDWDGTYVTVVDPTSGDTQPLALVEFTGCYAFLFGGPNDDAMEAHPLHGKGLAPYGAHLIDNSRWIDHFASIETAYQGHRSAYWSELKHYLLLFHDEMFECIARSHTIEVYRDTFANVMAIAHQRIFGPDN